MTWRDPGVYLEDIEHYAGLATRFIAGYDLDQYLKVYDIAVTQVPELLVAARNALKDFPAPSS
jgi:hypothetical protein